MNINEWSNEYSLGDIVRIIDIPMGCGNHIGEKAKIVGDNCVHDFMVRTLEDSTTFFVNTSDITLSRKEDICDKRLFERE
jgi:hypothetical protein